MARKLVAAVVCVVGFFSVAGCEGYDEEKATEICDEDRKAYPVGCFNDATYAQCLDAYQECGSDVEGPVGCPLVYTCSE